MAGLGGLSHRVRRWTFLHQRQIGLWRRGLLSLAALAAVGWGVSYVARRPPSSSPASMPAPAPPRSFADRALEAREAGHYDELFALIEEGLVSNPSDPRLAAINRELREDLQLEFNFFYQREEQLPVVHGDDSSQVALKPGDAYYLEVRPSATAYLYVFQISSTGRLLVLFPNPVYGSNANPVSPGSYRIPDDNLSLRVAPEAGLRRLYVVAGRWRQTRLEQMLEEIAVQADPGARTRLIDELTARLDLEERATDLLPGLSFGTYVFGTLGAADQGD